MKQKHTLRGNSLGLIFLIGLFFLAVLTLELTLKALKAYAKFRFENPSLNMGRELGPKTVRF